MRVLARPSFAARFRAPRRLLALLALGAVLAPHGGAAAAPGASAMEFVDEGPRRSAASRRCASRRSAPEVWYASIFGPKKTRGLCESTSKGTKPWVARMNGLEEVTSERDAWRITIDPKDDKTLYAVSRGKIFKSTNAGGRRGSPRATARRRSRSTRARAAR